MSLEEGSMVGPFEQLDPADVLGQEDSTAALVARLRAAEAEAARLRRLLAERGVAI